MQFSHGAPHTRRAGFPKAATTRPDKWWLPRVAPFRGQWDRFVPARGYFAGASHHAIRAAKSR